MKSVLKFLCICTVVVLSLSTPVMGMPQTNNQQATSANWIEVGTVIGDCYRDGRTWYLTGPKELKLYVLYLGEKLIYRVEWNGRSYPVVHKNNSSSSYNASARIPGWVYRYKTAGDYTSGKITDEAEVVFNVPTW